MASFLDLYHDFLCALCLLRSTPGKGELTAETQRTWFFVRRNEQVAQMPVLFRLAVGCKEGRARREGLFLKTIKSLRVSAVNSPLVAAMPRCASVMNYAPQRNRGRLRENTRRLLIAAPRRACIRSALCIPRSSNV